MGVFGGAPDYITGRATPLKSEEPLPEYEDWLLELIISCGINTPIDGTIKAAQVYEYNGAAMAIGHMTVQYTSDADVGKRWYVITDKAKQYIELMDKNETV